MNRCPIHRGWHCTPTGKVNASMAGRSTEGIGVYVFRDRRDAGRYCREVRGPPCKVVAAEVELCNSIQVDEVYLYTDDTRLGEPVNPSDSEWTRINKEVAAMRPSPECRDVRLTQELKRRGFDGAEFRGTWSHDFWGDFSNWVVRFADDKALRKLERKHCAGGLS